MCYVCCKETRGWCKSFTRTELLLTLLEGVLLVVLITLLVFLILHFIVCSSNLRSHQVKYKPTSTTVEQVNHTTQAPEKETKDTPTHKYSSSKPTKKTKVPGTECTWKPYEKTTPHTHYYEYSPKTTKIEQTSETSKPPGFTAPIFEYINEDYPSNDKSDNITNIDSSTKGVIEYFDTNHSDEAINNAESDNSDGEDAEDIYKSSVLALVKFKPPSGITFGCILTIITEYWAVTAASCIEAIEEVDSLDSFVMMEGYGELKHGRTHVVSNILIHPSYQGANRSYDIVALKSEDTLTRGAANPVELPSLVDYFMITIGERFIILGYGPFRSIDRSSLGRRLHKAYVYTLPPRLCPAEGGEGLGLRHLGPGAPVRRGGCARGAVCGGPLHARGLPCNYCAGTPLLRGPRPLLFGVMAGGRQCGAACEPTLYVNVADIREWLYAVID